MSANEKGSENAQRQIYFGLSPDEDQKMWQAFREGRAAAALNAIITAHVAREHHAGQAERADAWDEGRSFGARDRQMYEVGDGCGPDAWDCTCPNPYREEWKP